MTIHGIGFLIAFGLMALIWSGFVAPSERRYHKKKLQLLQERIRQREAFRHSESENNLDEKQADYSPGDE